MATPIWGFRLVALPMLSSLRIANMLVGNDEYAPALEMTLLGATLEFERSAIVAVVGRKLRLQGWTIPNRH